MTRRVLFQLSGSIAAYKACHAISRLVQAGCEVQTVATDGALKFVGAATLEGLSGRPVATDTFEPGSQMDHIHLTRWADVIVLCPATANTLNRLATGIADDLVGTMFLAHDFDGSMSGGRPTPYLVAPAMNTAMFRHPATQESIARLRGWGIEFLEPDAGALACGEIGAGRLTDPDVVVAEVLRRLSPGIPGPAPAALRVAVTSGGTKVPIDGVRAITNTSTGSTGAALAAHLAGRGHHVTLIHAAGAVVPAASAGIELVPYETFADLDAALRSILPGGDFDAVVHLAAVSDYDIDHLEVDGRPVAPAAGGKIDSDGALSIHLKRNPKLLTALKDLAGGQATIVGFKLTNDARPEARLAAVRKVARCDGVDLVVHNDLTEIGPGHHRATIYRGDHVVATADDNEQLAAAIEAQLVASPNSS